MSHWNRAAVRTPPSLAMSSVIVSVAVRVSTASLVAKIICCVTIQAIAREENLIEMYGISHQS